MNKLFYILILSSSFAFFGNVKPMETRAIDSTRPSLEEIKKDLTQNKADSYIGAKRAGIMGAALLGTGFLSDPERLNRIIAYLATQQNRLQGGEAVISGISTFLGTVIGIASIVQLIRYFGYKKKLKKLNY